MAWVWVTERYANEVGVLATWLCALLPWSVSVDVAGDATLLEVRFVPVFVRYLLGVPGGTAVSTPFSGAAVYGPTDPFVGGYAPWMAGALVLAVAVSLSLSLYVAEERVTGLLRRPIRVFGILLVVSGLLFVGATWFFLRYPGQFVPVGVVFQLVLGAFLATAEVRTRAPN